MQSPETGSIAVVVCTFGCQAISSTEVSSGLSPTTAISAEAVVVTFAFIDTR